MTKEEKKAIEQLDELLGLTVNAYNDETDESVKKLYGKYVDVYETVLNLIEKLQKENLLLSAKENMCAYFEFKRNYIPKDKIRVILEDEIEDAEIIYHIKELLEEE